MTGTPLGAGQVSAYLSRIWEQPVAVDALARIPGGASRETYRFDATADGTVHRLILRRDPGGSLIDTDSETEFRAYQSAWGVVPVPRAVALERDGAELERPFFIMERIEGGEVASPFARAPSESMAGPWATCSSPRSEDSQCSIPPARRSRHTCRRRRPKPRGG